MEAAGLEDTRHWLGACIAARSSPLPPCPCPCPWECRECRAARRARGVRRHRGGRARALLNGRLTMLPRPSALTRPAPGSKVRCLGCTRRVPWRSGTTWVGEVRHTATAHGIGSVRALLSGACGATQHPERLSAELWQGRFQQAEQPARWLSSCSRQHRRVRRASRRPSPARPHP